MPAGNVETHKCPHCLIGFANQWWSDPIHFHPIAAKDGSWGYRATVCTSCELPIIELGIYTPPKTFTGRVRAWPKGTARLPLPPEVGEDFSADYKEACAVLEVSPKASAALSRRCLQHLLREHVKVKPADLSKEIQEVLDSHALPSDLASELDAIRNVGNFAAHPMKSTNSGAILDVEPEEAEWTLTVLEELFDFYFVRTAKRSAQRAALNAKISGAGKPPLKTP
jgi:hypothetical protein